MNLDLVSFPALIMADDGWVEYADRKEDLEFWSAHALKKYNQRTLLLYDSENRAWRVVGILPCRDLNVLEKMLAVITGGPKLQVQFNLTRVQDAPLRAVRDMLCAAIDEDDDVLTQNLDQEQRRELITNLRSAENFRDLASALRWVGAVS
jgi:hypothetical protein